MSMLKNGEHIEYIDSSLKLIVSDTHTFGTDALLLAAFSSPKRYNSCCDFGTGCGIIPFYWLREGVENVHGVEIQELACDQLKRSIELNKIENRFTLVNNDLRKLQGILANDSFDVITMNPPYTAIGHGIESSSTAKKIARHETNLSLDELFLSASRLLKFGGKMCICLRPERLTEAIASMRQAKIEPKRLRFVAQKEGKAPWLFLLEGKKGRNPGLIVEAELHMKDSNGNDSEELIKIIGSYKKD